MFLVLPHYFPSYHGIPRSGVAVFGRGDGREDGDLFNKLQRSQAARSESGGDGAPITVKVFRNGFTLDDGPLRSAEKNETDRKFIEDIEKGVVPRELETLLRERGMRPSGDSVGVNVEDHRSEDYEPPPEPRHVPFAGEGQSLSGSRMASGAVFHGGSAPAASSGESAGGPSTTVMLRLANGKREKVTMSLSQTVADLQAKAAELNPSCPRFALIAGFPPRPLDDPALTIEAAGVAGSAVQQRAQ